MEPLTATLLTALIAGAAAATTTVASQAIKDAYTGLKQLVINTFTAHPAVATAVQQVEARPASQNRQGLLQEELETALAAAPPSPATQQALRAQAQALLDQLQAAGHATATYSATLTGSGAIAQGAGAVAAGQGGIAVGGSVSGSHLVTGNSNVITDRAIGRQVNTGGGSAIEGNVDTQGGDFIGRDSITGAKPT